LTSSRDNVAQGDQFPHTALIAFFVALASRSRHAGKTICDFFMELGEIALALLKKVVTTVQHA
jgi:hypothetical protein